MATDVVTPTPVVEQPSETAEQKYARLYEAPVTPVVVDPTPPPNELLDTVKALQQQITSLSQSVNRPTPQTPQIPVEPPTQWFDYLRQGEWSKAEEDLISRVRTKILSEAETNASSKAFEAMNVQLEVDRYLTKLRQDNPDIVPLEGYLQAPVQQRIESLKREGKITSNLDFVREYKATVEDEVKKLRNITSQYRAAGTQEARVRQAQVAQSTPLQPQQVSSLQEGSTQTPEAPNVSPENYFARRKAVEAIRKGMGPM